MEEVTRRNLFRREFERRVSDGTGAFDAEYMLKKVPEMLGLEERKVGLVYTIVCQHNEVLCMCNELLAVVEGRCWMVLGLEGLEGGNNMMCNQCVVCCVLGNDQ